MAAKIHFTPDEANGLRRAMATFRHVGTINNFKEKFVGRMVGRGYEQEFAERCFKQIRGWGSLQRLSPTIISFAHLVYISAWIKKFHPDAFDARFFRIHLYMGFYSTPPKSCAMPANTTSRCAMSM